MDVLNKILRSAIELFSQYGFKSITMDDIARRTAISKKTLYQHFANKHEVVLEAVIWYKNNITNDCVCTLNGCISAVEEMVKILVYFDKVYKEVNPMAMFELQRYFPEAYAKFRELIMNKDVALLQENMEKGIKDGLYRADINTELMARYRMETSLLALNPNLMINTRSDFKNVAFEIGEHFMYGILTPKGEEEYKLYKAKYLKK